MEKGTNCDIKYLLNYIGLPKKQEIETYITESLLKDYMKFFNEKEIANTLGSIVLEYLNKLNLEEATDLRSYTGYQFRNINAILRNNWNYKVNGKLTPELKEEYCLLAEKIQRALNKAPELPIGIKVYRGVSIQTFHSYGIFSLADLVHLNNQFFYEAGFTSTSLIENQSFYYKNPYTLTGKPNILIEYLIPEYSDDGIILLDESISYSVNQAEFLIKDSSLFKVIDVKVDETKNVAFLKMLLVPERIWNLQDYENERNQSTIQK